MAIPLIPWEPHVFPEQVKDELRRRSINRGMHPVISEKVSWKGKDDEWNQYRGPMTSWVRVCSNGNGLTANPKPGFVFYGGKDFSTTYGFNKELSVAVSSEDKGPNRTILGFTPEGVAHVLSNDLSNDAFPIHVPNPEIEKISANIQKELLRRVRIEWTCFSLKQLEYMTPYFLVPGISVIVEWGWNHFNPESLLDLTNTGKLAEYYNNPYPLYTENVLNSKGNYEVVFGIVTNFEWSIDGNKIKCVTEVTSKDRLWAGQLVDMNMILQEESVTTEAATGKKSDNPIVATDSLKKFVENYLDQFKNLVSENKDIDDIIRESQAVQSPTNVLYPFLKYVKEKHKTNYKDYLLGLFYGRDEKNVIGVSVENAMAAARAGGQAVRPSSIKTIDDVYANKEHDFDCQTPRGDFWINMGLIVEIINFFSSQLKGVKNQPLFRVDVDDCVIGGHPNLISTNGNVLLIPNANAPKYFYGGYGEKKYNEPAGSFSILNDLSINDFKEFWRKALDYRFTDKKVVWDEKTKSWVPTTERAAPFVTSEPTQADNKPSQYTKFGVSSTTVDRPKLVDLKPDKKSPDLTYANHRFYKICFGRGNKVKRDNLNVIINSHRFKRSSDAGQHFEFPFSSEYKTSTRRYEAYYTGLFKNLYLNAKTFREIFKNTEIKKFSEVYEAIFGLINGATSNFWDLKLVGSTGRETTTGLATMKIIDNKLTQYTSNDGEIFTFDYYAADGLLQAINFRPTLSNAQAIRTIYAQTNLPTNKAVVLSGQNELLDYKFKDRLFLSNDQTSNNPDPVPWADSSFKASMAKIQVISPPPVGSFQITTKNDLGEEIVFRLAIPSSNAELLALLLDDNDQNHNPRYTGIMPGIQAEFTIQGIAGLRTFGMFRVSGLPEPYSEDNIVFRIINVNDTIQNGQWVTQIVAGVIPLRGYFRSKLGLPPKVAKKDS